MGRRKPETIVLLVALLASLSVLLVFLADLVLSRQRDLNAGEERLQHFSTMMSEYTARAFESIDILLLEMAKDLSNNRRDWEKWRSDQGWEYVAQRHSRALPQLRDLILFNRSGDQIFLSTAYAPLRINVRDRPYFKAIEQGAEFATFGPYIGRNSGRYSYGLARRLNDANRQFAGVAFAALEPAYLQDYCWSNRLSDDFETVLINSKGQIIASCRPIDLSKQSRLLGSLATDTLFGGKLKGHVLESGTTWRNGLLISVSPVTGFHDLRILSIIPERTVLEAWNQRFLELITLGFFIAVVLLLATMQIRRQLRQMAAMTSELAANHEHLEERVRTATQALSKERDTAEKASRAKSRFLAAASHDLRQPLHALSLFSTDLTHQLRTGKPTDLPHLAEQIRSSTLLLSELLDSLLDVSRLDVEGVKPEMDSFELKALFGRLRETFRRGARERQQTLRFADGGLWIRSDPRLLEQILNNLIANALRYTPVGGRILIAARRQGDKVRLEVRDNGIGIAAEHQSAIFAEFYQVGNTAREQNKGLGLGLSIVDRLARGLGIEISLHSQIGEGTRFILLLERTAPQSAPPPERSGLITGISIRLIGDTETLRTCRELVEHWGYPILSDKITDECITITDAKHQDSVLYNGPLVVLQTTDDRSKPLPDGAHGLVLPLRPARLRALLNQLQKTLSKSMP